MQVADVLDDKYISDWVQDASEALIKLLHLEDHASRIPQLENRSNRQAESSRKAKHWKEFPPDEGLVKVVLEGLSMLPDHIQDRVLAAVCATQLHNSTELNLPCLLHVLPSDWHGSILKAAVTAQGKLTVPLHTADLPFTDALQALPSAPATISSLELVACTRLLYSREQSFPERFTEAMQRHSSLVSLRLSLGLDDLIKVRI